jgi:hypothetical protein
VDALLGHLQQNKEETGQLQQRITEMKQKHSEGMFIKGTGKL